MAFCSRCGKELPQGVKYCTECGAPVPQTDNGFVSSSPLSDGPVSNSSVSSGPAAGTDQKGNKPAGPLMGIVAMLLGLMSLLNHVTVISVGLSIAAIALAVRCLKKRARLKGFAIAAIVFAVLNFVTYAVPLPDPDSTGTTAAAAKAVTETVEEKAEQSEGAQTTALETAAEQTDGAEEKSTGAEEKKSAGTEEKKRDGAEDGVDPELKAFLDSYEDFVDEYIEFMQKYSANPTDLSLLAGYASIMQEYADFADKVEKYDSKDMSAADSAYYIEVTSRCSQKMLKALGN